MPEYDLYQLVLKNQQETILIATLIDAFLDYPDKSVKYKYSWYIPSSRDRFMPSTADVGSLNWITWFSKKSAAESISLDSTTASLALASSGRGSKDLADLGDPFPIRVRPSAMLISRADVNDSAYFKAFSCNQKWNLVTHHFTEISLNITCHWVHTFKHKDISPSEHSLTTPITLPTNPGSLTSFSKAGMARATATKTRAST